MEIEIKRKKMENAKRKENGIANMYETNDI